MKEELLKKAYDDCSGCHSCGWKGAWHEVGPFEATNHETRLGEYWAPCTNSEEEDSITHRGYYIYLTEPLNGE
jgi:hypothetical protein